MPKKAPTPAAPASAGEASLDPKAAEKAFAVFKPRMLALDADKLAPQSVDLEKVAVLVAAIGRWVKEKEPRERFASLPKKHFDQAHVEELEAIALSAWHAAIELRTANIGKSEAKLPVPLVMEATALRARMTALAAYNFGDDAVDGPEIEDIKVGTGYTDLASDLVRLRKLFLKHLDAVKLDRKNYQGGDEELAGRLAHAILKELGEAKNQQQKHWADLTARAWTLLVQVYDEVSAAGAWLWRKESAADRFPSLYAAGRASPGRPAKSKEATPPQEPAADAGAKPGKEKGGGGSSSGTGDK